MSKQDIKMYKELLELLDKRHNDGDIDKENYDELKQRYRQKLEEAEKNYNLLEKSPQIYSSGVKTISDDSLTVAGSARITGGEIAKDIRIAGSGKISSDVVCNQLKSAGSLKSAGNITAHGDVKCAGSFKCGGFLHGDKDAHFSGSAKISGETLLKGRLSASGSFSCLNNVQADNGARFSGGTNIGGNLISLGQIEVAGKIKTEGNIVGENVYINKDKDIYRLQLKSLKPSTVRGSVFGSSDVNIVNTNVMKNVKGLNVRIGPYVRVEGKVYYVDNIEIDKKARLTKEPIQISREELKL
ncbi:MAG: hypothetical protein KAS63_00965 [Candidatus Heimdallarchaeota archaeon]|nr:hypothetical protein [Candidatus Heimdallarchaeota archaeon]MCK4953915.1 hypothetical protein [Candidatus Heimdallarchaeota archaeon]